MVFVAGASAFALWEIFNQRRHHRQTKEFLDEWCEEAQKILDELASRQSVVEASLRAIGEEVWIGEPKSPGFDVEEEDEEAEM